MPEIVSSASESSDSDPALNKGIINLPAIATNLLPTTDEPLADQLIRVLAASYVRREGRFFHINRPTEPLTREDLQRAFLYQAKALNGGQDVPRSVMKQVYDTAIIQMNPDQYRSIPVWAGAIQPVPGNPLRRMQMESGQIVLNSWKEPAYRQLQGIEAHPGPFTILFHLMFQRENERDRVLDWLAWCLQNEHKKPNWALMLYSQAKGTGKSTMTAIAARLFGEENTSRQNNLEKVAGKFNGPMLNSKLIISEEVELRPGSEAGNKLKTLITEPFTTTERKGRDVERVSLLSCFLLTSNHLPLWIEAGERRFYVVDVGHEGHASGPLAAQFAKTVTVVNAALQDDVRVARLYRWLMERELADDFDPFTLNTAVHGTEVMTRLLSHQTSAQTQQVAEYLGAQKCVAVTEEDLRVWLLKPMNLRPSALRYPMLELGWTRHDVKWGGRDYAKAIWVAPKHTVDRGNIIGPDGAKQAVCDVLWASEQ